MRISDWSSDVCSSDLSDPMGLRQDRVMHVDHAVARLVDQRRQFVHMFAVIGVVIGVGLDPLPPRLEQFILGAADIDAEDEDIEIADLPPLGAGKPRGGIGGALEQRSEEPTSELQSLMRISYAVF